MSNNDIFGESYGALAYARKAGVLSGVNSGVIAPILMAGKVLLPQHLELFFASSSTPYAITVTAALYYIVPFYITPQTFAGVKFYNTGVGDNGKKVKIAFYNQSTSGGPGTLAKSFGESTLTGAAAIRTLASSWTPTQAGWYFGAITSDTTPALASMSALYRLSGVGYIPPNYQSKNFGVFPTDLFTTGSTNSSSYIGDTVAGTYANFPEATSLTPTASIVGDGSTYNVPAFGLYA